MLLIVIVTLCNSISTNLKHMEAPLFLENYQLDTVPDVVKVKEYNRADCVNLLTP